MSPFKSSAGRSLGKLIEGFKSSTIGQGFGSGSGAGSGPYSVTGGYEFQDGQFSYHVFTTSNQGTLLLSGGNRITFSDVLLVGGGGGGGGGYYGGGGGGGGIIHIENWRVNASDFGNSSLIQFVVSVGAGGAGSPTAGAAGNLGGDSKISYLEGTGNEKTWRGMGGGAGGGRTTPAVVGGCGGGTAYPRSTGVTDAQQPTSPTTHTGYPDSSVDYTFTNYGQNGGYPAYGSGGGGTNSNPDLGIGVPGPTASSNNPKGNGVIRGGGDAQAFPAFPSTVLSPYVPDIPGPRWADVSPNGLYGAGGGGGAYPAPKCYAGGSGGGGNGGNGSGDGSDAGGIGCGGGGSYPNSNNGGAGSPGIVIIRYLTE